MIKTYPSEGLGRFETGWLESNHHFSFGHYHNPDRMGFGSLRVINDDVIRAGTGFDPHPHQDMEIITYVRQGTIIHRDSLGNEGRTEAGDVQVMSAGTGIEHAEHADPDHETKIFQIWIRPAVRGIAPRWESAQFPKTPVNDSLKLLVSGRAADKGAGALGIYQDAAIFGGKLQKETRLTHALTGKTGAYVIVSEGTVTLDGTALKAGDGAEVTAQESVNIAALDDSEILVIEV